MCDCDAVKPRNQLTSVGAVKELKSQETLQFSEIARLQFEVSVNVSNKLKAGNVERCMVFVFVLGCFVGQL